MRDPSTSSPSRLHVPRWAWVAALAASVATYSSQSLGVDEHEARPTSAYTLASPRRESAFIEHEFVARLSAARHAEIRARVSGVIESVHVDEGAAVRADSVLFRVNARALEQELAVAKAMVRQAEAELDAARIERDNSELLVTKNVISPPELALAESEVRSLVAAVDERRASASLAQVHRDLASIRAPFDGVVNRIPRKAGSVVESGELLTTIADTSELFAYFHLSERDALAYLKRPEAERPQEVQLRLIDGTLLPERGRIDAFESEFDDNGTLAVRARFPNTSGLLRHGSSGTILLRDEVEGALLVPQKSTFDVQGNLFVYAVDQAGVAHARKIDTTARVGADFVVTGGLTEADRFVLEGVQRIRDGEQVVAAGPHPQRAGE